MDREQRADPYCDRLLFFFVQLVQFSTGTIPASDLLCELPRRFTGYSF
ncbi:MAG: hypothetical protein HY785_11410 [Oscillatoriophycideae cyanobacterium NC_groundwater_1537_Pr4_S-0.65um_50_18]|nr:hypothetical protein [Oscillatoriophycideae cyanobacterium NC_groundwater_1537_Pr4_S-0.65um_50_18]